MSQIKVNETVDFQGDPSGEFGTGIVRQIETVSDWGYSELLIESPDHPDAGEDGLVRVAEDFVWRPGERYVRMVMPGNVYGWSHVTLSGLSRFKGHRNHEINAPFERAPGQTVFLSGMITVIEDHGEGTATISFPGHYVRYNHAKALEAGLTPVEYPG